MSDAFQKQLDRLIDGELSPAEYRAFVASLDDQPGAWRRCGLAFLESQALARDLTHIRQTLDLTEQAHSPLTTHHSPLTKHSYLAIAASFLLAFSLGIAVPQFFSRPPQDVPLAGNIGSPERPVDVRQPAPRSPRPVGNIRLVMDGPGGEVSQANEVPVYEVGDDPEQYFQQNRPALAPELVELLRQRGHSVHEQRQYLPVQLDDGRQVVVPIEGYHITPVRGPAY